MKFLISRNKSSKARIQLLIIHHLLVFLKLSADSREFRTRMGEAIDTDLFRLVSSSALQALLDKIIGPKTLVLAPNLAGPLGLVTEVGLLKVSFLDSLLTIAFSIS